MFRLHAVHGKFPHNWTDICISIRKFAILEDMNGTGDKGRMRLDPPTLCSCTWSSAEGRDSDGDTGKTEGDKSNPFIATLVSKLLLHIQVG